MFRCMLCDTPAKKPFDDNICPACTSKDVAPVSNSGFDFLQFINTPPNTAPPVQKQQQILPPSHQRAAQYAAAPPPATPRQPVPVVVRQPPPPSNLRPMQQQQPIRQPTPRNGNIKKNLY